MQVGPEIGDCSGGQRCTLPEKRCTDAEVPAQAAGERLPNGLVRGLPCSVAVVPAQATEGCLPEGPVRSLLLCLAEVPAQAAAVRLPDGPRWLSRAVCPCE